MCKEKNPELAGRTKKPIPGAELCDVQRAAVDTAVAYYNRGEPVQYDSVVLTIQEKYVGDGAVMRETDFASPEDATVREHLFSVCSAYCFEVYYDAFGYQLLGNPLYNKTANMVALPADDPIVVLLHTEDKENQEPERRKADLQKVRELLQPGDLICGVKETGHVLMYVGDAFGDGREYVLHCWGKKYKMETGTEQWEYDRVRANGGAIRRDNVEDILFNEKACWPMQKCWNFVILRPANVLTNDDLTPSAKTRLQYPRLNIDRVASHDRFLDVEAGGDVTVTLKVANNALWTYNAPVVVKENIPANCTLKRGSVTGGGKVSGNAIVWELADLAYGQGKTLSYAVTADDRRGSTIRLEGGTVGDIRSNRIPVRIGGRHLTDESRLALYELAPGAKLNASGAAFAVKFYEKYLGLSPALPTLAQLEEKLFYRKEIVGAPRAMLFPKANDDEEFARQAAMVVPEYYGGVEVWTESSKHRVLELDRSHLYPGDVILCADNAETPMGVPACCVFLGNEKIAYADENGAVAIMDADILTKLFPTRFFVALRPTLAYDDIYAEAAYAENEDEIDPDSIPDGPEKEDILARIKSKKNAVKKQQQAAEDARARAEYEERVRGVVETVLAYWRRGERQQYESECLINADSRNGVGIRRATDDVSPEDATWDVASYFVCSTFAYNVYSEAIRYQLGKGPDFCSCRWLSLTADKSVVYRYLKNSGESIDEAVALVRQILRPGDVLVGHKASAHAMVYLGKCLDDGVDYIAHSWGKKYNYKTGEEAHEDVGTIRLQPVDELCFRRDNADYCKRNKLGRWCLYDMHEITVLRPLRITSEADYPLTPNARARLAHPGLNIERTADFSGFRTLPRGGNITYTITVENHSKTDYAALPITDRVPKHTTLVSASGATENAGKLLWLADVPAGGQVTVQFTVQTGEGKQVLSEGGDVAGIRTPTIVTTLTGPGLTEQQNALLAGLATHHEGKLPGTETGMAFAVKLYKDYLGEKLALPETDKLLPKFFDLVEGDPGAETPLLHWKKRLPAAAKLLLPRYQGGLMLLTATAQERILEFKLSNLLPGDILLYVKKPMSDDMTQRVLVYLGDGAFAEGSENGLTVTRDEVLWPAFCEDLFLLFRPAMGE